MFLIKSRFPTKFTVPAVVVSLLVLLGVVFAKTVTRPLDVTLRTHIKICQKNPKGLWQKTDEVGPATLKFQANLLELAAGSHMSSDFVFRTRSKKGKPYSVRLLKPANVLYNPVSGLFSCDVVYEISYGKKKATVPAKITTESLRGPLGVQKGVRARGALARKPMSMTLVSANSFQAKGEVPLMLVCKEEYRLVPAGKKSAKRDPE